MIYIGCHLSVTDGYLAMGKTMLAFGGNTFAWFTRNPRGGRTKSAEPGDVRALEELARREHFGPLVAHGSYTMNLCSAKEETRANGLDMLRQDLERMELLPGNLYNFHPGAHTGLGTETGIQLIADALNQLMTPQMQTTVLQHFDNVIGLSRLKAVHFNDSRNDRGSHKDRHEKLGRGFLGMEAMKRIALHPALQGLPFILETPNEDEGYIEEIHTVLSWMEEEE